MESQLLPESAGDDEDDSAATDAGAEASDATGAGAAAALELLEEELELEADELPPVAAAGSSSCADFDPSTDPFQLAYSLASFHSFFFR